MNIHCHRTTIELDEQEVEKLGRIALIAQEVCNTTIREQNRHATTNLKEIEFGGFAEIAGLRDMAEYLSGKLL